MFRLPAFGWMIMMVMKIGDDFDEDGDCDDGVDYDLVL